MEQDNHIMIDLETLGLKQDAAIIAIGAAKFNIPRGVVTSTFHRNILWEDALRYGNSEPDTVQWWSQQNGAAKDALDKPTKIKLFDALDDFETWMEANPIVWGNGACFDLAKLERVYENQNIPHPWFFRDTRDLRTVAQIGEEIANHRLGDRTFTGVKHNPVDDAVNAALYVCEVFQWLRGENTNG